MDYKEKLREYIDSIKGNPAYRLNYKEWAYGAVDFAYNAGLIVSEAKLALEKEYQLLEN